MRILLSQLKEKYNINSFTYLTGKTIHDDAASHHVRFKRECFINLRQVRGELSGVTGTIESPQVGSVREMDEEWQDVVFVPDLNYNIDSEKQLVDEGG